MIRYIVHFSLALPAIFFLAAWLRNSLGVDPEKILISETGIWSFNFILAVTLLPLIAKWTNYKKILDYRRALGLWTFFYATVHFFFFLNFILDWDIYRLVLEIADRPYVLAGFAAWLILLVLANTSFKLIRKKLGKSWKRIHRWVYLILICASAHYLLMIRSDWLWPTTYTLISIIIILKK